MSAGTSALLGRTPCHDAGELLAELYSEYHPRGLEMVGLASEFADDFETDAEMVRRYALKYGIEWPLLLMGPADKKATAAALSALDRVLAYPTFLLVGRDGSVQKVYTGFSGPGTGSHHTELRRQFREIIEEILR